MEKLEVLKRSDLFRELNDEGLKVVAKICTAEEYKPGTIIHQANTIIDRLYVIEEGLVAIILEPGPLCQRQLSAVTNFESFGWEAIIPPHLATATAKALEQTKVLAFSGNDLWELCHTRPELSYPICLAVARVIADRLHAAYMQCLGVTAQE